MNKAALAGFALGITAAALIGCAAIGTGDTGTAPHVDTPSVSTIETPALTEDSPGWDCRVQGNRQCGAPILGADGGQIWYVISFDAAGSPIAVTLRSNQ